MDNIVWDVAEVIGYDRTYKYVSTPTAESNISELFALQVRSCGQLYNQKILIAKPGNVSIKKIPLVGEFVLIYKTFNQQTTDTTWRESWYYLLTVDLQSSINENMIPGISGQLSEEQINNLQPGYTFKRKSISPLQPYEGDVLIEGRVGNSIRFGSTISNNYPASYYFKQPTWSGADLTSGDPIIILSNRTINRDKKEFVIEDVEQDASSLYLTSTQQLDTIKLSNPLTVNNNFIGSQLIGGADRIILRAKKDIVLIDSEKGIVLNTSGDIKLGDDSADQSMVHGEVLTRILNKLARAILSGGTASGAMVNTNTPTLLTDIASDLEELTSKLYKIKKT
jgi:hypothetical protein